VSHNARILSWVVLWYLGRTLSEDILNPTELTRDGECVVLFPKGEKVTEAMIHACRDLGIETISMEDR